VKEKKRLLIITIGTFFLFSLLIVQYFRIQIVEGDIWAQRALSQHEFIVKEPAKRGAFFSNTSLKKGNPEKPLPFVVDVTKFHLFIDPVAIPEPHHNEIKTNLFAILEISDAIKQTQLSNEFDKKSRSRKLSSWLEREQKENILKWWKPFAKKHKIAPNALFFVTDYQRSYPYGKLLGQVLHTIRDLKDEVTQEGVPTGGLEAHFNDYLKGKQGKRILLRSPLNSLEIDKVIEPPENGSNIYLTVNHTIQAIAEEELERGVKRANAKGGWAVMMDPNNGEILAFAQYPYFEPGNYKDYFNEKEKIENAKAKPLTDTFELGSIMKPITVAIALKGDSIQKKQGKKGIVTPNEKVETLRSIYPGRANKPLKDKNTHNYLNMYMAIQKSSNVYMAQVIDRVVHALGNPWYRNELVNTFGFGTKTGIELPGEALGLVPTPGKCHPNGALEWSIPTPYSLSMGYNIMASSIQMLRAYAVFANGGKLVKPTLVRKIVKTTDDDKEIVLLDNTSPSRQKAFPRVLSKEICLDVMKAMKYTTKLGGSAHLAAINGYTEAGKTGTAEKIVDGTYCKKRHISSFIGFAPANLDPSKATSRIVLIVTIDDPEYRILEGGTRAHMGGWCAAPVFRDIAKRTLEYLGVTPDDPFGYCQGDPRCNPAKADYAKELQELKDLYNVWNKKS
jgi:cell division protein FtsI (penicillin-binding protein 3)